MSYELYTDGAYSSSRNQGGIAVVILKDGKVVLEHNNMYKNTTNIQMELMAVITGLSCIKNPIDTLTIYTDSMYVIGGATLGWKRKANKPLWKLYDKVYEQASKLCPTIEFKHVKGHEGNKYNEVCDKLAVAASQQI